MGEIGKTTHRWVSGYRVLATHWESECYTEAWTADIESAIVLANLLQKIPETTVQIDLVHLLG